MTADNYNISTAVYATLILEGAGRGIVLYMERSDSKIQLIFEHIPMR